MAHDVFISYSSQEKSVADAVCATLENQEIRCWYAPRDVPPGTPYATALVHAIKDSRLMVLILSHGSNTSDAVMREVEEAVDSGIPILPLRIDDIEPTDAMRYYLKPIHWIDAMNPPRQKHLGKLAESAQALLSIKEDSALPEKPPVVSSRSPKRRKSLPIWAILLLGLTGLGIIAGGVWLTTNQLRANDKEGTGSPAQEETEFEWRSLSFVTPNPNLWRVDNESYTALEQHHSDAFAWSQEVIEGDLTLNLELFSAEEAVNLTRSEMENHSPSLDSGCVILYGDGQEFSAGCLIFCIDWDGYYLEKNTRYSDQDPLAFIPKNSFNRPGKIYNVTITISDNLALMNVDGEDVLSTFINLDEIDRSGRIGFFRNWSEGEITFSNPQVKFQTGSNK